MRRGVAVLLGVLLAARAGFADFNLPGSHNMPRGIWEAKGNGRQLASGTYVAVATNPIVMDNRQNALQTDLSKLYLWTVGIPTNTVGNGIVSTGTAVDLIGTATYGASMSAIGMYPKITLRSDANIVGMLANIDNGLGVTNDASNKAYTISFGYYDHPVFTVADGNSMTWVCGGGPCYVSAWAQPTFSAGTGSSQTISVAAGLWASPVVNSGATLTEWAGVYLPNSSASGTGVITNQYGIHNFITAGTNKYFLYDSGGAQSALTGRLRLGDTNASGSPLEVAGISGTLSTGVVNMAISSTFTTGANVYEGLRINATATMTGTAAAVNGINVTPSVTISANNVLDAVRAYVFSGTITPTVAPTNSFVTGFLMTANSSSSTASVSPLSMIGFDYNLTMAFGAATTSVTTTSSNSVFDRPVIKDDATGGTFTLSNLNGFHSAPSINAAQAGGTVAVGTRRAVEVDDISFTATGTATLTDNVGVELFDMVVGTSGNRTVTNVYGIRSALAAATNKWFLYSTGTAASALSGGLMLGGTGAPEGAGFLNFTAVAAGTCGSGEYWMQANSTASRLLACSNGFAWQPGATSTTSMGRTLSTGNGGTDFLPIAGCGLNTTTACVVTAVTEASQQMPTMGAAHYFAMACGLSAAPGTSAKTRTFTFMKANATASTNLTCTITDPATSCSVYPAASDAVAAAALVSIKAVANQASTAAANATCTLWYTLDAF